MRVRSDFKKGSFEVALLLDHSLLEHAKNLLFPAGATIGGAALIKLLFGAEASKKSVTRNNVLDLWKKLKAEKPKEIIKDPERGITIIVNGDGNRIKVDSHTAALYEREAIKTAVAGVARPVARRGIKSLEIRKGKKALNEVLKSDLPLSLNQGEAVSQTGTANVKHDTREAVVRVTRANFEKGKWGFSDGAASFSAEIADQAFKEKLDSREIGFYKGDTLRVVLVVTQVVSPDGQTFQTKYEIEKVLGHDHAPSQRKLLPPL